MGTPNDRFWEAHILGCEAWIIECLSAFAFSWALVSDVGSGLVSDWRAWYQSQKDGQKNIKLAIHRKFTLKSIWKCLYLKLNFLDLGLNFGRILLRNRSRIGKILPPCQLLRPVFLVSSWALKCRSNWPLGGPWKKAALIFLRFSGKWIIFLRFEGNEKIFLRFEGK